MIFRNVVSVFLALLKIIGLKLSCLFMHPSFGGSKHCVPWPLPTTKAVATAEPLHLSVSCLFTLLGERIRQSIVYSTWNQGKFAEKHLLHYRFWVPFSRVNYFICCWGSCAVWGQGDDVVCNGAYCTRVAARAWSQGSMWRWEEKTSFTQLSSHTECSRIHTTNTYKQVWNKKRVYRLPQSGTWVRSLVPNDRQGEMMWVCTYIHKGI